MKTLFLVAAPVVVAKIVKSATKVPCFVRTTVIVVHAMKKRETAFIHAKIALIIALVRAAVRPVMMRIVRQAGCAQ